MVDLRGPLQELALGRLTLTACPPMAGETDHRWPRLATPAHKCCCCCSAALQGCCCNCAAELCKAAGPALRGSSQAPPPSSCDLLQPVFFLRPWARRKLKTGTGNRDGQ